VDLVTDELGGVAIVSPAGDIDSSNVPEFQQRLDELLANDVHQFVLDFSRVRFVDSAGLAAVVRLYKRVRIGEGDVRLAAVPPQVMEVLDLTRLSRVFEIFPTAGEAAASFGPQA
jgi:anti-anti-sigma factor